MKSGTNWIGRLLDSHHEINVFGEFRWHRVVAILNENLKSLAIFESEKSRIHARLQFEEMVRNCMAAAADPGAKLIGDRTPHSIVPTTLRGVPHVSVMRDGRDVLVSRVFHLYNHPEITGLFGRVPSMAKCLVEFQKDQWYFQKHPEKLLCHEEMVRNSIRRWKEHLEKDERAIETYPKLKVAFVRYEDFHRDVEGERKKLFEFLDVDPNLAAPIQGRIKPGFSKERPGAFHRKGVVGDWENYFSTQTKAWFKELAGDMLVKYGYAESMDW